MLFNEDKLKSFAKPQPAYQEDAIKRTHEAIRNAIIQNFPKEAVKTNYNLKDVKLETYLQGSYINDTNIRHSSDVDIAVEFISWHEAGTERLNMEGKEAYQKSKIGIEYSVKLFKNDIQSALAKQFGASNVTRDNKCIRFKAHENYAKADIVPSWTYRLYKTYNSPQVNTFDSGIYFVADDGKTIVNYPKQHKEALAAKSKSTNGQFKETVRMFKNIRNELKSKGILTQDVLSSHFIEILLFNVSDNAFSKSTYADKLGAVTAEACAITEPKGSWQNRKCANGIIELGKAAGWSQPLAFTFFKTIRDKVINV